MEFRFDLHPIFNQPIIKVNSNLLPIGFRGDRRAALDTATKIAEVINEMGEASARAQGLSNPVTTAQKLRMTDQNVYLLGDPNQGRNGAVVGLLKVGQKSLYVFDQNGQTKTVNAPCVLDFYIHESRQRSGLGRDLFDTMLKQEEFKPEKLAVDRPSDKLLGFLRKHYGLQKTIPQMNNFVVYDGFFEKPASQDNVNNQDNRMHLTASPNTALFGPQFINDEQAKRSKAQLNASNTSIPLIQSSPVGRYAAPRPMCSMAEVLSSSQLDQNASNASPSGTNLNRPTPSKGSIHSNGLAARQASNAVMNNPNLQPSNIPVPVASSSSVNRNNTAGNVGMTNIPVASNTNIIRERAAGMPSQNYAQHAMPSQNYAQNSMPSQSYAQNGLPAQNYSPNSMSSKNYTQNGMPSQNYAQHGDTQSVTNEATLPPQPQVHVDVNPAEPIDQTNIPIQEIKQPSEQVALPTEISNEVFHEVCPNCSAKFPSTRNSAIKIVQSNTVVPNQEVNVMSNQPNDPIIHNTATPATGEPNREL